MRNRGEKSKSNLGHNSPKNHNSQVLNDSTKESKTSIKKPHECINSIKEVHTKKILVKKKIKINI